MKIIADLHSHTLVSQHAYNTVTEYIAQAKKLGLAAFAMTDHGPHMPDGAHTWHFMNLGQIPEIVDGVRVYKGAEANIIDHYGNLDLDDVHLISEFDVLIASYHGPVVQPASLSEHTASYLALAKNPFVDILGHSGTQAYAYEYEPVVRAFHEAGKLIEINSNSFLIRKGAKENCKKIAQVCKAVGASICVNSDCHSIYKLAEVSHAIEMLQEIDFPEELIVNADFERLERYLRGRRQEKQRAKLQKQEQREKY